MYEASDTIQGSPTYSKGDIVWVKLSSYWWPGEVVNKEDLPGDLLSDFKKLPLVIVKFFDEDSYEYVRSWSNVHPYDSDKKSEFIKKGMAGFRSKLSHMAKFPKDIGTAEEKTNGNPNILSQPEFLPVKKVNYDDIFGTPSPKKSTKGKVSLPSTKKTPARDSNQPHITHRRFLGNDDYRAYICIQYPGKDRKWDSDDEEIKKLNEEPEKLLTCHSCSFKTKRLEVMILHTKMHIQGIYITSKRKTKKPKEADASGSESDTVVTKSPKPKQRKKKEVKPKTTDVFTNLLEEWDDTDEEMEETTANKKTPKVKKNDIEIEKHVSEDEKEETQNVDQEDKSSVNQISNTSDNTENIKSKSSGKDTQDDIKNCFDFDEEEEDDDILLPTSVGRKIPRVIPEKPKPSISELLEQSQKEDELEKAISNVVGETEEPRSTKTTENGADASKKEILKISQSLNREPDVDDNIANTFKELMAETELPALDDLTQNLKPEQNFHDARTVKFPDKGGTTLKGGTASKCGTSKKRFVTSFEDFEAGFRKLEDEDRMKKLNDKEVKTIKMPNIPQTDDSKDQTSIKPHDEPTESRENDKELVEVSNETSKLAETCSSTESHSSKKSQKAKHGKKIIETDTNELAEPQADDLSTPTDQKDAKESNTVHSVGRRKTRQSEKGKSIETAFDQQESVEENSKSTTGQKVAVDTREKSSRRRTKQFVIEEDSEEIIEIINEGDSDRVTDNSEQIVTNLDEKAREKLAVIDLEIETLKRSLESTENLLEKVDQSKEDIDSLKEEIIEVGSSKVEETKSGNLPEELVETADTTEPENIDTLKKYRGKTRRSSSNENLRKVDKKIKQLKKHSESVEEAPEKVKHLKEEPIENSVKPEKDAVKLEKSTYKGKRGSSRGHHENLGSDLAKKEVLKLSQGSDRTESGLADKSEDSLLNVLESESVGNSDKSTLKEQVRIETHYKEETLVSTDFQNDQNINIQQASKAKSVIKLTKQETLDELEGSQKVLQERIAPEPPVRSKKGRTRKHIKEEQLDKTATEEQIPTDLKSSLLQPTVSADASIQKSTILFAESQISVPESALSSLVPEQLEPLPLKARKGRSQKSTREEELSAIDSVPEMVASETKKVSVTIPATDIIEQPMDTVLEMHEEPSNKTTRSRTRKLSKEKEHHSTVLEEQSCKNLDLEPVAAKQSSSAVTVLDISSVSDSNLPQEIPLKPRRSRTRKDTKEREQYKSTLQESEHKSIISAPLETTGEMVELEVFEQHDQNKQVLDPHFENKIDSTTDMHMVRVEQTVTDDRDSCKEKEILEPELLKVSLADKEGSGSINHLVESQNTESMLSKTEIKVSVTKSRESRTSKHINEEKVSSVVEDHNVASEPIGAKDNKSDLELLASKLQPIDSQSTAPNPLLAQSATEKIFSKTRSRHQKHTEEDTQIATALQDVKSDFVLSGSKLQPTDSQNTAPEPLLVQSATEKIFSKTRSRHQKLTEKDTQIATAFQEKHQADVLDVVTNFSTPEIGLQVDKTENVETTVSGDVKEHNDSNLTVRKDSAKRHIKDVEIKERKPTKADQNLTELSAESQSSVLETTVSNSLEKPIDHPTPKSRKSRTRAEATANFTESVGQPAESQTVELETTVSEPTKADQNLTELSAESQSAVLETTVSNSLEKPIDHPTPKSRKSRTRAEATANFTESVGQPAESQTVELETTVSDSVEKIIDCHTSKFKKSKTRVEADHNLSESGGQSAESQTAVSESIVIDSAVKLIAHPTPKSRKSKMRTEASANLTESIGHPAESQATELETTVSDSVEKIIDHPTPKPRDHPTPKSRKSRSRKNVKGEEVPTSFEKNSSERKRVKQSTEHNEYTGTSDKPAMAAGSFGMPEERFSKTRRGRSRKLTREEEDFARAIEESLKDLAQERNRVEKTVDQPNLETGGHLTETDKLMTDSVFPDAIAPEPNELPRSSKKGKSRKKSKSKEHGEMATKDEITEDSQVKADLPFSEKTAQLKESHVSEPIISDSDIPTDVKVVSEKSSFNDLDSSKTEKVVQKTVAQIVELKNTALQLSLDQSLHDISEQPTQKPKRGRPRKHTQDELHISTTTEGTSKAVSEKQAEELTAALEFTKTVLELVESQQTELKAEVPAETAIQKKNSVPIENTPHKTHAEMSEEPVFKKRRGRSRKHTDSDEAGVITEENLSQDNIPSIKQTQEVLESESVLESLSSGSSIDIAQELPFKTSKDESLESKEHVTVDSKKDTMDAFIKAKQDLETIPKDAEQNIDLDSTEPSVDICESAKDKLLTCSTEDEPSSSGTDGKGPNFIETTLIQEQKLTSDLSVPDVSFLLEQPMSNYNKMAKDSALKIKKGRPRKHIVEKNSESTVEGSSILELEIKHDECETASRAETKVSLVEPSVSEHNKVSEAKRPKSKKHVDQKHFKEETSCVKKYSEADMGSMGSIIQKAIDQSVGTLDTIPKSGLSEWVGELLEISASKKGRPGTNKEEISIETIIQSHEVPKPVQVNVPADGSTVQKTTNWFSDFTEVDRHSNLPESKINEEKCDLAIIKSSKQTANETDLKQLDIGNVAPCGSGNKPINAITSDQPASDTALELSFQNESQSTDINFDATESSVTMNELSEHHVTKSRRRKSKEWLMKKHIPVKEIETAYVRPKLEFEDVIEGQIENTPDANHVNQTYNLEIVRAEVDTSASDRSGYETITSDNKQPKSEISVEATLIKKNERPCPKSRRGRPRKSISESPLIQESLKDVEAVVPISTVESKAEVEEEYDTTFKKTKNTILRENLPSKVDIILESAQIEMELSVPKLTEDIEQRLEQPLSNTEPNLVAAPKDSIIKDSIESSCNQGDNDVKPVTKNVQITFEAVQNDKNSVELKEHPITSNEEPQHEYKTSDHLPEVKSVTPESVLREVSKGIISSDKSQSVEGFVPDISDKGIDGCGTIQDTGTILTSIKTKGKSRKTSKSDPDEVVRESVNDVLSEFNDEMETSKSQIKSRKYSKDGDSLNKPHQKLELSQESSEVNELVQEVVKKVVNRELNDIVSTEIKPITEVNKSDQDDEFKNYSSVKPLNTEFIPKIATSEVVPIEPSKSTDDSLECLTEKPINQITEKSLDTQPIVKEDTSESGVEPRGKRFKSRHTKQRKRSTSFDSSKMDSLPVVKVDSSCVTSNEYSAGKPNQLENLTSQEDVELHKGAKEKGIVVEKDTSEDKVVVSHIPPETAHKTDTLDNITERKTVPAEVKKRHGPPKKSRWSRRESYSNKDEDTYDGNLLSEQIIQNVPEVVISEEVVIEEQSIEINNDAVIVTNTNEDKYKTNLIEKNPSENASGILDSFVDLNDSEIILPPKKSKRVNEVKFNFLSDSFASDALSLKKKVDSDILSFPSCDDSIMSTSLRNNIEGLIKDIDNFDSSYTTDNFNRIPEEDGDKIATSDVPKAEEMKSTINSFSSADLPECIKEPADMSKCVPPKKKKIEFSKQDVVSCSVNNLLQTDTLKSEGKLADVIPQPPKKKIQKLFESSQALEKFGKVNDIPQMSPLAKKKSFLFHPEEFVQTENAPKIVEPDATVVKASNETSDSDKAPSETVSVDSTDLKPEELPISSLDSNIAEVDVNKSSSLPKKRKKRKSSSYGDHSHKKERRTSIETVETNDGQDSHSIVNYGNEAIVTQPKDENQVLDTGSISNVNISVPSTPVDDSLKATSEHKNEMEVKLEDDDFKFCIQTNLTNLATSTAEELSALATATLSEIKNEIITESSSQEVPSSQNRHAIEELVIKEEEDDVKLTIKKEETVASLEPIIPEGVEASSESQFVPISINPTVMSEKDLADAQVEITTDKIISEKKPTSLGMFSMDFLESSRASKVASLKIKKKEVTPSKANNTSGTEFTSKAMTKEFDNRPLVTQPKAYALKSELLDILEGNSNSSTNSSGSEQKFKTSFDNYDKHTVVQGMFDFEEAIPSQIVLSNKVDPETVLMDSPKLLERLSMSADAAKAKSKKVVIQSDIKVSEGIPKGLITKITKPIGIPKPGQKIVIKTTKAQFSTVSKATGNKPIILSEQIIRPANVLKPIKPAIQPQGIKRQYEDIEDVETAFIITKIAKKSVEEEEEDISVVTPEKPPRARNSKSGKAKILQQTIITPKGEIIQPKTPANTTTSVHFQSPQSQSDDTVFDINSMPIVLSDDILTPESIQNMPVVLSEDVIPHSKPVIVKAEEKALPTLTKKVVTNVAPKQQIVFKTTLSGTTTPSQAKQTTKPRILSTTSTSVSKIAKPGTTALLATGTSADGKPTKYVLVPSTVTPTVPQVKAIKPPVIKKTPLVQSKVTSIQSSEPPSQIVGNKIMIVTNQHGQQTRVVLTPQQQKAFMHAQPGSKTKAIIKGAIPKALLESAAAGPSGIAQKATLASVPQGATSTVSSQGGLLMTVGKGVKAPIHPKKTTLKTTSKPQKTILIKNQMGQTVRKIQGTDDDDLDRQVAEQLEAIKASARLQQANKTPEIINYTNRNIASSIGSAHKPVLRRPYSKKIDPVKVKSTVPTPQPQPQKSPDTVIPALAPLSPQPRIPQVQSQPLPNLPKQALPLKVDPPSPSPVNKVLETVLQQQTTVSTKSETKTSVAPPVEAENKPADRPLTQLVIQDGLGNQTTITEGQILAIPSETVDGQPQSYMLVTLDEMGNITPLNNEALMSLDPSLGLGGDLNNMVLQVDQGQGTVAALKPAEPSIPVASNVEQNKIEERLHNQAAQKISQPAPEPKPAPVEQPKPQEVPLAVEQQIVIGEGVLPGADAGGQQLIVTGDPIATQKFLESLSDGSTDLANILANAEGGSVLIQADGQQILIKTNTGGQPLLDMAENTEGGGNPIFGSHKPNQDILAAALANTDVFQQSDQQVVHQSPVKGMQSSQLSPGSGAGVLYPMHVGNVLETSLTLSSPIMTPLEVPSMPSKKIEDEADILNQIPKNVDLPITITDPNISQTVAHQQAIGLMELNLPISETTGSADINSPSYSYSLPALDEPVHAQKPFNGSMPLLTEDVTEIESSGSSQIGKIRVAKGLHSTETSFGSNFGSLPLLPETIESSREEVVKTSCFGEIGSLPMLTEDVIEDSGSSIGSSKPPRSSPKSIERDIVDEGLSTLGGEMCSSLSEPPPDMFDLASITPKEEEISSDMSSIPEPDGETLSLHSENSGEIPLQPPIVANINDLKRPGEDTQGQEEKRQKFD